MGVTRADDPEVYSKASDALDPRGDRPCRVGEPGGRLVRVPRVPVRAREAEQEPGAVDGEPGPLSRIDEDEDDARGHGHDRARVDVDDRVEGDIRRGRDAWTSRERGLRAAGGGGVKRSWYEFGAPFLPPNDLIGGLFTDNSAGRRHARSRFRVGQGPPAGPGAVKPQYVWLRITIEMK